MSANVEAQTRTTSVTSWESLRRSFHIDQGPAEEVRVHTYFYPHWVAVENGQNLPTRPAADGLLLISVPADAGDIELVFREPSWVRSATRVSIVAWLLIAAMALLASWRGLRRSSPAM